FHRHYTGYEIKRAVGREGFTQRDPAYELTLDRAFGRLDGRPRPLVEVAYSSSHARGVAPALQATSGDVLDDKESARGERSALPEALAIGGGGDQRSRSWPRRPHVFERLDCLCLAGIAPG